MVPRESLEKLGKQFAKEIRVAMPQNPSGQTNGKEEAAPVPSEAAVMETTKGYGFWNSREPVFYDDLKRYLHGELTLAEFVLSADSRRALIS